MSGATYELLTPHGFTPPKPQPRAPLTLPICGSCPSPNSYDKTSVWLPAPVPQTRDYLRADFGSMVIPDLTPIGRPPAWAFTWLFDLWDDANKHRLLDGASIRGYTHFHLSWPDMRAAGVSMSRFKESMKRVKRQGLYCHVKVMSKDFDPHDQTLAQWQAYLGPALSEILGSGFCDETSPWEYDLFNVGGQTSIDVHRWLGQQAHAAGCSFWAHFASEHSFWADSFNQFWKGLGKDIDGIDYQGDPSWDIGLLQAHLVDVLNRLVDVGSGHKCRAFELILANQFASGHQDEDHADVMGYLATCTRARAPIWGFGEGARTSTEA